MIRIAPLAPPYQDDVAEDLQKLMPPGVEPLGLFRTLAHNPRVLRRLRRGGLLDRGSISVRERELVILRTTALCGSEYEWGVHVHFFAAAAGFTADELAATVSGRRDAFAPAEQALIEMCDALHARAALDEALWTRLRAGRGTDAIIELVALAGQYHMVSYLTNALGIENEPHARRFPAAALG